MNSPVTCLRTMESISRILHIMECETLSHNGFPVVDCDHHDQVSKGTKIELKPLLNIFL